MCHMLCFSFITKWRYWIRPFVVTLYAITIVVLLPILAVNTYKGVDDKGKLIGGLFVMMALPISLWQIIQHMVHYNKPFLQKHIIRVLWMVPIYAVNAWLGLVFPNQSIYVNSLRECYEAYVIYNFMMYLLNYLNSETNLEASLELKPQVSHFFPLCCLPPWAMGREFVHMCRHGILQYTIVRPLTSTISFLCELNGVYGEGEFKLNTAYPYMLFINNLSQFLAMYCLVLFYKANKDELRPMKPVGKFLCIKAVVFFSFFQGVIISVLVYTNVISIVFNTAKNDNIQTISSKLQNFIICIEMFLAAIAHHYSFNYKDFVPSKKDNSDTHDTLGCWDAFAAMWDVSDVHRDLTEHIGVVGSSLSRTIRGQHGYKALASEISPLLATPGECGVTTNRNYSSNTDSFPQSAERNVVAGVSRNVDMTAKEAEKCSFEYTNGKYVNCGGIPVYSPQSNLIDFAPEVPLVSEDDEEKPSSRT